MLTNTADRPAAGSALARLLARQPPTDIQWGLERIDAMLAALGSPHQAWPSIHVAGTNGKGSVAATAASVLEATGRKVGLYTSPHLVDFRERIVIGGAPVDADFIEICAARVLPLARRENASFFESVTALAFLAFAEAGIDSAVVEVGLGGRLDATNVIVPRVAVVTGIARDHADYLGDTLEEIAIEKAGIAKPGIPLVLGPMPDRLLEVFRSRTEELAAPTFALGIDGAVESVRPVHGGTRFTYRSRMFPSGIDLCTPLHGSHQATNAALAVLALEKAEFGPPSVDVVRRGVAAVQWPGRFHRLERGGPWILDMAHNTAAADALSHALVEAGVSRPVVPVLAILGDKPWREMLEPLLQLASAAVFTVAPSSPPSRRWDPVLAAEAVRGHRAEVVLDFGAALARARELAGEGTVVVTGSAHTVGDALRILSAPVADGTMSP